MQVTFDARKLACMPSYAAGHFSAIVDVPAFDPAPVPVQVELVLSADPDARSRLSFPDDAEKIAAVDDGVLHLVCVTARVAMSDGSTMNSLLPVSRVEVWCSEAELTADEQVRAAARPHVLSVLSALRLRGYDPDDCKRFGVRTVSLP